MCYETEKTMMLFMIGEDKKIYKITMPLITRIQVTINDKQPYAEIKLFNTTFEIMPKKINFFSVSITNSPYARHESFWIDLGMHCFSLRLTNGSLKQENNCLIYSTNDFKNILVKPTLPQRRVTENFVFKKKLECFEFITGKPNSLQVMNLLFNKNLNNRVHTIGFCYDYEQNIGSCRVTNFSMKSIFASVGVLDENNFLELNDCKEWNEKKINEIIKQDFEVRKEWIIT
jgi:hypothetical protein